MTLRIYIYNKQWPHRGRKKKRDPGGRNEEDRLMAMEAAAAVSTDQEKKSVGGLEFLHQVNDYGDGREEDMISTKEKDQLKSAKAEMGHVREENQRLKVYLDQIMGDYRTLQMQFQGIVKQAGGDKTPTDETVTICKNNSNQEAGEGGSDLVSLSLGRAPSSGDSKDKEHEGIIDQKPSPPSKIRGCNAGDKEALGEEDQRLKLGLDCKYEVLSKSNAMESTRPNSSPASSVEEQKNEEPAETWPPGKATKRTRGSEDEASLRNDNPVKKARVSIRVRCDSPTLNDGCQWRKYGQKIAKGNPCPRAYYRCTVSPSCPVRKQVQRWVEDMSILITTYEGTHNHPLPMAATAVASTTSAAAQMLVSGSSSSSCSGTDQAGPLTAISNPRGLNMPYISPEMLSRAGGIRSPYFLHTNSSSSSCPTITLDLTAPSPYNPSSSSSSSHLLTRFNPSTYSPYSPQLLSSAASRSPFSSTSSLSFNSSDSIPCALPITSWGINTGNGLIGSALSKNQDNNSHFQHSSSASSILSSNDIPLPTQQTMALPETIAAAAKAITADPNFQTMLVAALKSIIGGGNRTSPGNPNVGQSNYDH